MASVSQEWNRVRARIHAAPLGICQGGGLILRQAILDQAKIDTGGDLRLSNVWWMNFTLDVEVTVKGDAKTSTAVLTPFPLRGGGAIWSWLERGTRPHVVGISKKGRRKMMLMPWGWRMGPTRPTVRMPPKRTWSRGIEKGTPKVIELAEAAVRKGLSG